MVESRTAAVAMRSSLPLFSSHEHLGGIVVGEHNRQQSQTDDTSERPRHIHVARHTAATALHSIHCREPTVPSTRRSQISFGSVLEACRSTVV